MLIFSVSVSFRAVPSPARRTACWRSGRVGRAKAPAEWRGVKALAEGAGAAPANARRKDEHTASHGNEEKMSGSDERTARTERLRPAKLDGARLRPTEGKMSRRQGAGAQDIPMARRGGVSAKRRFWVRWWRTISRDRVFLLYPLWRSGDCV